MSRALANLPVIALLTTAAVLAGIAPDLYHRSVQEDGILEWTTFWSFVAAGAIYWRAAIALRNQNERLPWFLAGLGLFCFLVGLEEISWGQRLLGYRPPDYFLAQNFQQEFNLHNTLSDPLRQGGFLIVAWGYGVLLALSQFAPPLRRAIEKIGVTAPPPALAPSFAATAILYQVYPWSFSGEWAEAMLGSTMLFVAVIQLRDIGERTPSRPTWGLPFALASSCFIVALAGVGSARLGWLVASNDPKRIEAARIELAALRNDIASARTRTHCGIHKRVYTLVTAYNHDHLFEGEFASMRTAGLPEARARFFLDPWNSPYWIQHICSEDHRRRAIFVYSVGPNRTYDSTDWDILADDIAAWISRP